MPVVRHLDLEDNLGIRVFLGGHLDVVKLDPKLEEHLVQLVLRIRAPEALVERVARA